MKIIREFDTDITQSLGASGEIRPHAITFDGKTAFDIGPIDLGDILQGLDNRAWRLRIVGTNAFLCKANDDNTGWESESVLFSHASLELAKSLDLTFDQNGKPFACWESSGSIYIHYYSPIILGMETVNIGIGRTPRAKLDVRDSNLSIISDIILFYIDDIGNVVKYKLQRDRYLIEYTTNIVDINDKYLELMSTSEDNRLYLWYSKYDSAEDKYLLYYWHSSVYYYSKHDEKIELVSDILTSGESFVVFKEITVIEEGEESTDEIQISNVTLDNGSLINTMETIASSETDEIQISNVTLDNGSLVTTMETIASSETDEIQISNVTLDNGSLVTTMAELLVSTDEIRISNVTLDSGTLN